MDSRVRDAEKLLEEGCSYLGMLAEINAKCLLLENRLEHSTEDEFPTEQAEESLLRMKQDLAKYSRKIDKVCEGIHGIVSELG